MRTTVCSGQDVQAFLRAVDETLAGGLRPSLAVVFCSVSLDLHEVQRGLDVRCIAVAGTSTAGEIANNSVLQESCAALLMEADPAAFAIRLYPVGDGETMFHVGRALGRFAASQFADPIVLAFASGVRADGEPLVPGVQEGAGRVIPLFGGMAGDDLAMSKTFVFSGAQVVEEGLLGLVLDGQRFDVTFMVANGWQAVGVAKTVTHAQSNVVYTIDGRPALEVYKKYLRVDTDRPRVYYPLRVQRPNGTTVMRTPLLCLDDQSIIFAGTVPEGSRVMFCVPPSIDIVERVLAEAETVRQRMPKADAIISISCVARLLALGPLAEDEIAGLHSLWGTPMAGFFSYGEIAASDPRNCDFHNETCALAILRAING